MDSGRRGFLSSGAATLAAGLSASLAPRAARSQEALPSAPAPPQRLVLMAAPLAGRDGRLSYDGTAGGPVVRVKKGVPLSVSLINRLGAPTSLQWHGLRASPAVDGPLDTAQALAPDAVLAQTFTPPDSGLLWFHPAALPGLPDQAAAGLRGILIVEDTAPPLVDRDLALLLSQDDVQGSLTVNGAASPLHETIVTGGRLRLRLVNATSSRILVLAIEGARPKVIAIDGQPSDLFEPVRDAVPAGPGARFEFLVDCPATPGAAVRLLSRGIARGEGPSPPDQVLLDLVTAGAAREPLPPIATLPRNPALPPAIPLERSARATLVIDPVPSPAPGASRWRLNGAGTLALAPSPLLSVARGGSVTFAFDNRAPIPVPLRVHGQAMRLLHAKDDGWEPYWRDSVILAPVSVTHVAFVADAPGRWLIESADVQQAAFGLRTWFQVT